MQNSIATRTKQDERGYTSYLKGAIDIVKYGTGDDKINKGTESHISIAFERAMLESHFRMGDDILMGYDGYKYVRINDNELHFMISEVMSLIGVGEPYIVNSVKVIATHVLRKMVKKKYTPHKNLVSMKNCVVDLDTMETYKHSERFQTHIYIDYDYDPRAKCDRFRQFLVEVMPDEPTQMVLQEFFGCMFVDRKKIKMERVLYLIGPGRNGKGVMTSVINEIAGAENRTSFQLYDLLKGSDKNYNIAEADGKLINTCSDMDKVDISGGQFKTYVSGEAVSARHIYGKPFMAENPPVLVAAMNELPVTTDYTLGQIERPLIVPFHKPIPEEKRDTELTAKLMLELAGIFNWVVEGRNRFISNRGKFTYSAIVEGQKRLAKENSNSIMRFLAYEHIEPIQQDYNTGEDVMLSDLYKEYSDYCIDEGADKGRFSRSNLSKMLSNEGYHKGRKSHGIYFRIYRRTDFSSPEFDIDEDEKMDALPF